MKHLRAIGTDLRANAVFYIVWFCILTCIGLVESSHISNHIAHCAQPRYELTRECDGTNDHRGF
jgi:hypothetical protein